MTARATTGSKAFDDIHDREISRQQWLIVLISGMGFFTDAYDLFVIGVALKLMNAEWHFSHGVSGPMTAAALMAGIGYLVTLAMLPEPNGQTLDAASRDDLLASGAASAPVRAFGVGVI